ncbi:MAG: hypothetical protein AB7V32_11350, partial [Candidatus Berkiella sp.]
MSLLFELEDNEYNQVQSRFNELFGKLQTTDGEKSYFEVFNNDVKVINNLLCDTAQEMHFYQKAYVLQEEYNEALMLAKERWSLGNKGFHNGASIIKDLSARKRAYDSSMQTLKTFDEKLKLLNSFTQKNNGNDEISKSPTWLRLEAKAQELDSRDNEKDEIKHTFQITGQTRLARLHHLAQIWQSQGILSKGNTSDILKFMKELDNIEGFLDFINNKIGKSTNPVDIRIQEQVTRNRQQLTIYRENSIAALGWRIVAAIGAGNLQCDDSLLGLMSELKTNVFHGASDEELEDIKDLLVIPDEVKTFDMKFDDFAKALNILTHGNQPYWYQRWLNSRWVTNTYKGNLIEVVVKDNI